MTGVTVGPSTTILAQQAPSININYTGPILFVGFLGFMMVIAYLLMNRHGSKKPSHPNSVDSMGWIQEPSNILTEIQLVNGNVVRATEHREIHNGKGGLILEYRYQGGGQTPVRLFEGKYTVAKNSQLRNGLKVRYVVIPDGFPNVYAWLASKYKADLGTANEIIDRLQSENVEKSKALAKLEAGQQKAAADATSMDGTQSNGNELANALKRLGNPPA